MDTLDSRGLRSIDCFAQMFSKAGRASYRLTTTAGSCLPIEEEGAFRIEIKRRPAADHESSQHDVAVRLEGLQLVAEPRNLEIVAGDTVLWNAPDAKVPGFAVQGVGPEGSFDSSAMTRNAVYTHAFGTPGEYQWVDANGGHVSGVVYVRSLDPQDPGECRKWLASLAEGSLILIREDRADHERIEILTGQTVFWAVEGASGISITDARLVQHYE